MKKPVIKLLILGFVQYILLNIMLFIVSLAFGVKEGSEMSAPPPLGFIILAVAMLAFSYIFCQRLIQPTNRKQAIAAGIIWSGMTTIFLLIVTIGNGTQGVIFGNWGAYLVLVSQALGSMLVKVKKAEARIK